MKSHVVLAVKFTKEWVKVVGTGSSSLFGRTVLFGSDAIVGMCLAPFAVTFKNWARFVVKTGVVQICKFSALAVNASWCGHRASRSEMVIQSAFGTEWIWAVSLLPTYIGRVTRSKAMGADWSIVKRQHPKGRPCRLKKNH